MTLITNVEQYPTHYQALDLQVANVQTLDEALSLKKRVDGLDALCRIWKKDTYTLNQALGLRLKLERRIGQMLLEEVQQGGSRYRTSTLNKYGISKTQSAHWQALAVHDDVDIDAIVEDKGDQALLTLAYVYGMVKPYEPKPRDDRAAWRTLVSMGEDYLENGEDEERRTLAAEFVAKARELDG